MNSLFDVKRLPTFTSESAEYSTIHSLIPVQMDDETTKEFRKVLHPRKHPIFKRNHLRPFEEMFTYLAYASNYINAIFDTLCYLYNSVPSWPEESQSASYVSAVFRDNVVSWVNASDVALDAAVKDYIGQMSSGRNHIIKDSERFKGGKDILFTGMRGSNSVPTLQVKTSANYSMPHVSYNDEPHKGDSLAITKALVSAANELQEFLFHKIDSYAHMYARQLGMLPITATFLPELQNILSANKELRKVGLDLQLPDSSERRIPAEALDYLNKYYQILVIREPSSDAVRIKANNLSSPDESLHFDLTASILQPRICFSFALNLPPEWVQYIAQAKENEKPSLASLNTWASTWVASMLRLPRQRGGLPVHKAPMYILRPSQSADLLKRRADLKLYSDPGRVNDNNLVIQGNGTLAWYPKQDEVELDSAKEYERLLEEALEISFDAGSPLGTMTGDSTLFKLHPKYSQITEYRDKLTAFKGTLMTVNWDLNSAITVNSTDPSRLSSTRLTGGAKPSALNIASYLRTKASKALQQTVRPSLKGRQLEAVTPGSLMESNLITGFITAYNYYQSLGLLPKVSDIVNKLKTDLGVTSLDDPKFEGYEYQRNRTLYRNVQVDFRSFSTEATLLSSYLEGALKDAEGSSNSFLARKCMENNTDLMDDPHYFNFEVSNLAEFSNIYNYFGGKVFLEVAKAFLKLDKKLLMHRPAPANSLITECPSFSVIAQTIVPFLHLVVTYPQSNVFEQADQLEEANKEAKFSDGDIQLPGSRNGMMVFPHQAKASSRLRNHPEFAVYDIAAGGGKTTLGIIDFGQCVHDKVVTKPGFVICPPKLVANWCEDLHMHTGGTWNTIPITTETYAEWGDEKLTQMILSAPINTLVVVGTSFLSSTGKTQLVIGNSVEPVSNSVEFIKKFQPEWVLVDESHRLRNTKSSLHNAVKSFMLLPSVKYKRLATGSLIQNVLADVVGQSAMFNGQVFRTREEFEAEHKGEFTIAGETVNDYLPDAPQKARERLADFATVLTVKRKEWAFMLPIPIETFISVSFEKTDEDDVNGRAHRMFYDAVLKETLEELRANKMIQDLLKGKGDEDEDSDEEGDSSDDSPKEGKIQTASGIKLDAVTGDDDSENLDALEAALQPYLQRLERILTDPFGDEGLIEVARKFFPAETNETNYTPAKVRKVVERLRMHFDPNNWVKGETYKSGTLVDYNGKSYVLRPDEHVDSSSYVSVKSPDTDTEEWKEQVRGKVLVFCRFKRTVDAILRALPTDLKRKALGYHGDIANKEQNFNSFKTNDAYQIFVANEQSISEGHNLQMASRLIRVEAPWAPGELDQSAARIFRPDVGGKHKREHIYLDWIIVDGSLEVAKMGRLISKMLRKTQFDELYNPKYYKNLNPMNLPIIKMSLDNIQELSRMSDLCAIGGEGSAGDIHPHSYIGQYKRLVNETADEFREMRKTLPSAMLPVEPTPQVEGANIIQYTPWVPHMNVPDRNAEGLVNLAKSVENPDTDIGKAFREDKDSLIGQVVRTEFGLGTIQGLTTKRGEALGVSKVRIALVQGSTVLVSSSKVFLATALTAKQAQQRGKDAPKFTDSDKKRTSSNKDKADAATKRQQKREQNFEERLTPDIKRIPIAPPKVRTPKQEVQKMVELYPIVYNGFLAVEAITPTVGETWVKKYGFKPYGDYAFIEIKSLKQYTAVLDWFEKTFTIATRNWDLLDDFQDGFTQKRGVAFNVELLPNSEFKNFFQMSHRVTQVTNKKMPELKVYPIVAHQDLLLAIDLSTNPVFNKWVGKTIPGVTPAAKIASAEGLDIAFVSSKSAVAALVKQMRADGVQVTNLEALKGELQALTLKPKKM